MDRRAQATLGAALAALCAVSCIPSPEERIPLAVRQASLDLDCPGAELTARHLGDRLFEVRGCGRQATYRVICKLTVHSCDLLGGPDDQQVMSSMLPSAQGQQPHSVAGPPQTVTHR